MKQSRFVIDTFPGQSFKGYSSNEEWNGWACPYFTFEEAQKIVHAQNSEGTKAWFDEKNDQFIFEMRGDKEFYPAFQENGQKLYPIGNGSWIWEESND